MLFNSIDFMFFFPIVLAVYFVIPRRGRYLWLLLASYFFYMSWNPKYAVLILFSTLITYVSGILLEKETAGNNHIRKKKWIVAGSVVLNLAMLGYFKYFQFVWDSVTAVLSRVGMTIQERAFDILLPVGISFYTFQALSYTIDVYRGEIHAEKNFFRYALFVSFFPQLVAGPIERSKNLLAQIKKVDQIRLWDLNRIVDGALYMIWGYFMKMVIADRAAILVDEVFNKMQIYGSVELLLAAFWFAIQIYCDFGGYSMIAIGAAKVMGFSLMENFDTPYFSMNIKEFWRRWHISLSSWFKDYVYIPLGGNRKGKQRKYVNLLVTFLVSGLWHGAAWTYVIWGALHGMYQILGDFFAPVKEKCQDRWHIKRESFSHKIIHMAGTFLLVDLAWIFFRADSVSLAFAYIKRIFTKGNPWAIWDGTVYTLGLDRVEMKILVLAAILLFLVDLIKYCTKKDLVSFLRAQDTWFAWGCAIALILVILIYGVYGPNFDAASFIYFQF